MKRILKTKELEEGNRMNNHLTSQISVEELVEEEKEKVQTLLIDSYQQYEHSFSDPEFWRGYLDDIKSSLENPFVDRILVAKLGQEIVGTVQLFKTAEKAYKQMEVPIYAPFIRLLAVHPKARGRGIAIELLKACVAYAKEIEAKSIYLFTGDEMAKAIRLYEWFGFKRDLPIGFVNDNNSPKCYRFDL